MLTRRRSRGTWDGFAGEYYGRFTELCREHGLVTACESAGPVILNWMLEGLLMLLIDIRDTGDIRLTDRQAGVVDSLLAESDSLRWFIRENIRRQDGADLSVHEIVEAYAHYCPERGWDPLPESKINNQLQTIMLDMFQVLRTNNCQRDGKAVRGFRGVAFNDREAQP